jgi:hypothetical protein
MERENCPQSILICNNSKFNEEDLTQDIEITSVITSMNTPISIFGARR